jgi:two-component system sensor histidine kinase KdpD
LLERAVANVVINAMAANPSTGPVRINAEAFGEKVLLEVVDHGPGIPEPARERVFAPFQRLDDSTDRGTGLGLAIARGFVDAMEGELELEETPGGGLTVTIALPVEPGPEWQ